MSCMQMYVSVRGSQGPQGLLDAQRGRNAAQRTLVDSIGEVKRVLQLTSNSQVDLDELARMKRQPQTLFSCIGDALLVLETSGTSPYHLPPTPYPLPPTPYPLPPTPYHLPPTTYPLPPTPYPLSLSPTPAVFNLFWLTLYSNFPIFCGLPPINRSTKFRILWTPDIFCGSLRGPWTQVGSHCPIP